MKWKNFVERENERFVRLRINNEITLSNLYEWLLEFDCCFFVFTLDGIETRYRLPKFSNENDFNKWVSITKLSIVKHGVNSENFDISNADYIDMYFKYPNK